MDGEQPTLESKRLLLRPLRTSDAPRIHLLVGDRRIAQMTENIPHPYPEGQAEAWIALQPSAWRLDEGVTFGIVEQACDLLVGCISLILSPRHQRASLGYWVGVEYWNNSYCSEAAAELVRFGFEELELNRIEATHLSHNPASGRVMQKIGMQHEGTLRRYIKSEEGFFDSELYSILKS